MNRYLNYMHLKIGDGRITCAIDHPAVSTEDADIYPDSVVNVGVSFCSPKDVFVKKTGRQKAFGRLKTGGNMTFGFSPVPDKPYKQQVREVLEFFMDSEAHKECPVTNCWSYVGVPRWADGKALT